jgi:hypothetical protein
MRLLIDSVILNIGHNNQNYWYYLNNEENVEIAIEPIIAETEQNYVRIEILCLFVLYRSTEIVMISHWIF